MKKILPFIMVLILGLTACSDSTGYAGKYTGTFSFLTDNTTKSGSVRITSNPLSDDGLLLYGCLPLEYVSSGTYEASSDNAEYLSTVLSSIVGDNSYIDSAEEAVKNINVEAVFSGSSLEMSIYYEVELLSLLESRVEIITFTGSK